MCGILGLIHLAPGDRPSLSDDALERLAHRGPDGHGVYTDSHVQFGHARLSIIDLTQAARQPMATRDGRYVVTFNGEIYNYLELRAELEASGEQFASHSDTEVLLAAYRAWGRACLDRFLGMFAFVIWDRERREAFIARDRCGEKPLFYSLDGERFAFASELKALLPLLGRRPSLNVSAVDMYLHYQYVPEPFTLLDGVHKLAAGHCMTLALDDWQARPLRYWCVETAGTPRTGAAGRDDILSTIRDDVEQAVVLTLRSDVPVGIALSGGIDSGAIAVLAQRHYPEPMHAFCVGYPGRPPYDERAQARALAESLGMIVHEVELPVDSFVGFFPELVAIMDEPIADPAAFGHYAVPRAAADHGVKVLLSGVGGDEDFWGYPYTTQAVALNQLAIDQPWITALAGLTGAAPVQKFLVKVANYPHAHPALRRAADTLQRLGDRHNAPDQLLYYMQHPEFPGPFELKGDLYGPAMQALAPANPFLPTAIGLRGRDQVPAAIIRMLFETWLVSNCLSLGDRVSMAVGVETRMPFLDARLIGDVMALRARHPDHALGQKAWLRAALKGVVPDAVLARPKAGFQPPVREWLTGVVERYADVLREGELVRSGVLVPNRIEHVCTRLGNTWPGLLLAYKLVLLETWYQRVVAS